MLQFPPSASLSSTDSPPSPRGRPPALPSHPSSSLGSTTSTAHSLSSWASSSSGLSVSAAVSQPSLTEPSRLSFDAAHSSCRISQSVQREVASCYSPTEISYDSDEPDLSEGVAVRKEGRVGQGTAVPEASITSLWNRIELSNAGLDFHLPFLQDEYGDALDIATSPSQLDALSPSSASSPPPTMPSPASALPPSSLSIRLSRLEDSTDALQRELHFQAMLEQLGIRPEIFGVPLSPSDPRFDRDAERFLAQRLQSLGLVPRSPEFADVLAEGEDEEDEGAADRTGSSNSSGNPAFSIGEDPLTGGEKLVKRGSVRRSTYEAWKGLQMEKDLSGGGRYLQDSRETDVESDRLHDGLYGTSSKSWSSLLSRGERPSRRSTFSGSPSPLRLTSAASRDEDVENDRIQDDDDAQSSTSSLSTPPMPTLDEISTFDSIIPSEVNLTWRLKASSDHSFLSSTPPRAQPLLSLSPSPTHSDPFGLELAPDPPSSPPARHPHRRARFYETPPDPSYLFAPLEPSLPSTVPTHRTHRVSSIPSLPTIAASPYTAPRESSTVRRDYSSTTPPHCRLIEELAAASDDEGGAFEDAEVDDSFLAHSNPSSRRGPSHSPNSSTLPSLPAAAARPPLLSRIPSEDTDAALRAVTLEMQDFISENLGMSHSHSLASLRRQKSRTRGTILPAVTSAPPVPKIVAERGARPLPMVPDTTDATRMNSEYDTNSKLQVCMGEDASFSALAPTRPASRPTSAAAPSNHLKALPPPPSQLSEHGVRDPSRTAGPPVARYQSRRTLSLSGIGGLFRRDSWSSSVRSRG